MSYRSSAFVLLVGLSALAVPIRSRAADLLPLWTERDADQVLVLSIPDQLEATPEPATPPRYLILELDPDWSPEWQQAAFLLKNLIVTSQTRSAEVLVGIQATPTQLEGLMDFETAAYIDGYLFREEPYLPSEDQTGKLWQRAVVPATGVLGSLLEAASLGVQVVVFEGLTIDKTHRAFLSRIAETDTGSLDIQPEVNNFPAENVHFFFDPGSGRYHLALYAQKGTPQYLSFTLAEGVTVTRLFPEEAAFEARQYGRRTELDLAGETAYYFFELETAEPIARSERLEIRGNKVIDPYELVVENQVFREKEAEKFDSLMVDEDQNFNYQVSGGVSIDLTYRDTLIYREGKPLERIRREIFFGGAKWRYEKPPELPLLQPDKVQREPLEIDLDKTYAYKYRGEATVDGHRCWKVAFTPTVEGNFFSGTVWIDQETGAHRRVTAIQSGLEAPVTGNEVTVYYDWVEDGGTRYWTQVREAALQLIDIAGERVSLQITSTRDNYRFNRAEVDDVLEEAYAGNATILRDTDEGLRYLVEKGGERVVSENDFTRARGVPGGVILTDDAVLPLLGYNITDLDFRNSGWQANFLIAGAVNDLILSKPDFLGRGMDFTAELFATAFYFEDSVYENGEEVEPLTVEQLRQSLNLTLGVPLNTFWKLQLNYALAYRGFKEGDEMNLIPEGASEPEDPFTLPSDHFLHIGRANLLFSYKRFTSELQYETATRSEWEAHGLESSPEPLFDSYSRLSFDAGVSKRLGTFEQIEAELTYLKGWDLDRFSRFEFGFFGNNVAGFAGSGIEADEAYLFGLEYEFGVGEMFTFDVSLEGARAIINDLDNVAAPRAILDEVDFYGVGLAANFVGPWRTIARINLGYGIDADIDEEAGNLTGQILFIKLF